MRIKNFHLPFIFITALTTLVSCQKEIDGIFTAAGTSTVNQKPKLGTQWTYRYYIYQVDGSLLSASIIVHRAKTEETLGGEKWLNIVDVNTDTTVYYLNEKTGGLYQYTNNSSNLLCKFPATANDTYTTYNEGSSEIFKVVSANDTLLTGIGSIPVNYYEGFKGSQLIDLIWFNEYAWIIRKSQYRNRSIITPFFYKYYSFFLDGIVY